MPSKTATDYDRPKAVLFTHSFNGLTLEDVIGMGPTRPTLEQVRAVDFVMEMTDSGAYVAHPTSAESHIDIAPSLTRQRSQANGTHIYVQGGRSGRYPARTCSICDRKDVDICCTFGTTEDPKCVSCCIPHVASPGRTYYPQG